MPGRVHLQISPVHLAQNLYSVHPLYTPMAIEGKFCQWTWLHHVVHHPWFTTRVFVQRRNLLF